MPAASTARRTARPSARGRHALDPTGHPGVQPSVGAEGAGVLVPGRRPTGRSTAECSTSIRPRRLDHPITPSAPDAQEDEAHGLLPAGCRRGAMRGHESQPAVLVHRRDVPARLAVPRHDGPPDARRQPVPPGAVLQVHPQAADARLVEFTPMPELGEVFRKMHVVGR